MRGVEPIGKASAEDDMGIRDFLSEELARFSAR